MDYRHRLSAGGYKAGALGQDVRKILDAIIAGRHCVKHPITAAYIGLAVVYPRRVVTGLNCPANTTWPNGFMGPSKAFETAEPQMIISVAAI